MTYMKRSDCDYLPAAMLQRCGLDEMALYKSLNYYYYYSTVGQKHKYSGL